MILHALSYTPISARLKSRRKSTRESAALQIYINANLQRDLDAETRRASSRRYWMEER